MEDKMNNSIPVYNITGDINDKQDGNFYAKLNDYTIYQFNNKNASSYFLAVPEEYTNTYQLFIGFPQKEFKYTKKEDVIQEIDNIKKMISAINKDGIYVLPNIPLDRLEEAARENDNKKYAKLLNNSIKPIISDVYLKIKNYNNANKTVDQLIYFVKQSESDIKFIQWLEINLPNFVHGISYDEIKKYYYANVSEDKEDLDKTIIVSKDELFESPVKEETNVKSDSKKRILSRPDANRYGFGNITSIILILSLIVSISIIIGNLLLK